MIMPYFDLTVLSLFSGVQCVNVSTGYPWFGIVDWYWTKMFSNDKTLLCDIYCYLSCSMLMYCLSVSSVDPHSPIQLPYMKSLG